MALFPSRATSHDENAAGRGGSEWEEEKKKRHAGVRNRFSTGQFRTEAVDLLKQEGFEALESFCRRWAVGPVDRKRRSVVSQKLLQDGSIFSGQVGLDGQRGVGGTALQGNVHDFAAVRRVAEAGHHPPREMAIGPVMNAALNSWYAPPHLLSQAGENGLQLLLGGNAGKGGRLHFGLLTVSTMASRISWVKECIVPLPRVEAHVCIRLTSAGTSVKATWPGGSSVGTAVSR